MLPSEKLNNIYCLHLLETQDWMIDKDLLSKIIKQIFSEQINEIAKYDAIFSDTLNLLNDFSTVIVVAKEELRKTLTAYSASNESDIGTKIKTTPCWWCKFYK